MPDIQKYLKEKRDKSYAMKIMEILKSCLLLKLIIRLMIMVSRMHKKKMCEIRFLRKYFDE